MGSSEFSEWLAYHRIEPSTYHVQLAILEAVVDLVNCWQKKPVSIDRYLPRGTSSPAVPHQRFEDQVALIRARFGGLKVINQVARP